MEKNKPISVAFEDIRNNPDFIEHSEYRFINDDLGMVISFQAMGFRLFRTQQPYRAKEGRIVRIMQGKGRISINLIEYEATAHDIIIIPDNSLIEISEVSPDYEFQVIMPTANFLPVLQNSILSEAYTRNGIRLSCNNEEWAHISSFFSLLWNILHCLPYRRGAVQHLIVSLLYNLKYIHEHTHMQVNSGTPFTPGRAIPPLHRFGEPTQQARTQRQLLCRQTMPDTALSELGDT